MYLKALLVGCSSTQSNQLPSAVNEKGERDLQVLAVHHCSSFLQAHCMPMQGCYACQHVLWWLLCWHLLDLY